MTKKIVWIEDDIEIIEPVVRPLVLAGYQIHRLHTAKEALEAIETIRDADLILLDMILRPGDIEREFTRYPGLDILAELRSEHDIQTHVIALTVVSRSEVRQRLRELGVENIIRKPVRPSELKAAVEEILNLGE